MKNNYNKSAVKWSIVTTILSAVNLVFIFGIIAVFFWTFRALSRPNIIFAIPTAISTAGNSLAIIGILWLVIFVIGIMSLVFGILWLVSLFQWRDSLDINSNESEKTLLLVAIIMWFFISPVAFIFTLIVNSKLKKEQQSLDQNSQKNSQLSLEQNSNLK